VTLRLLSYNIRFGGRGREARIAEVIRAVAPDLVVFQEASDPRVVERVAGLAGMAHWAARPAHSTGYVSRFAPAGHEWHHPAGARHAFLEIVLEGGGARVFGLHLSARFSKWSERRRAREIGALLEGIRQHQEGFHVLVGDFNTLAPGEVLETRRMPAWIQALIWVSGRDIRRETIERLLGAGYADGFRRLHPEDRGHTFPTWDPHVRLDYVFLPERFADRLKACDVITLPEARAASDHFPLRAEIEVN
jgi:endonuclease/exonuclease/phosphatase family metal-dependent hydrolase